MSVIYGRATTFGGSAAPAIFGDGSDGGANIDNAAVWSAEVEDTGFIEKNFTTLTVTETGSITAGNRNAGMIIRVQGDCTIAGSIINKLAPKTILDSDGVDFSAKYPLSMLNATAGDGGKGGGSVAAMTGRAYGGGWGSGGNGGRYGSNRSGGTGGTTTNISTAIADSTLFVGGTAPVRDANGNAGTNGGGGSGAVYSNGANYRGGAGGSGAGGNGGGGSGGYAAGGGGAGNIGGGVIILLVGGKLTITGTIDCSGSAGGRGGAALRASSSSNITYGGNGGGGGGGGRIFICHKGDISNTGTLNVNGGSGGAAGAAASDGFSAAGTAGAAGAIGTTAVKTYKQYMEEDVA